MPFTFNNEFHYSKVLHRVQPEEFHRGLTLAIVRLDGGIARSKRLGSKNIPMEFGDEIVKPPYGATP